MRELTYREALREAMTEEMERDERVFLMGEEVGHYNGAYKVSEGLLDRFGLFFGAEVRDQLYALDASQGPVRLWGQIADPACERGNAKMQYLFVNGRWIRDRSLGHAVQFHPVELVESLFTRHGAPPRSRRRHARWHAGSGARRRSSALQAAGRRGSLPEWT